MFTLGSSRSGDVNDVIYDAEGAREGQYWCTRGLIWVQVRADMGSRERDVMGLKLRAVSARVTKHCVNILSKICNKQHLSVMINVLFRI